MSDRRGKSSRARDGRTSARTGSTREPMGLSDVAQTWLRNQIGEPRSLPPAWPALDRDVVGAGVATATAEVPRPAVEPPPPAEPESAPDRVRESEQGAFRIVFACAASKDPESA